MTVSPTEDNDVTTGAAEAPIADDKGVPAEAPAANEDAKADSSPAPKAAKETLVDRIKKAADDVSQEKSPVSDGKTEGSEAEAKPEGEATEEEKPFTKDDLGNLHSKTRKRVGKLLETVENLSKENDSLRPAAVQYQGVVKFLKDNDLTMDDANTAFEVLRAIRHDPNRALEMLAPIWEQLQQATGAVLPSDLATKVQQGYLTEADAKEMARLRAVSVQNELKARDSETKQEQRQVEEMAANVKSIQQTITSWESKWASSDPDYQKKRNDVKDMLELALSRAQREGKLPKTPNDALALAEDCRRKVEARFNQFKPQKPEIRHVTGSSAVATKPQPKTSAEAILQAVNA